MNLTPRQLQIVNFIYKYRRKNGLAPTLAEIGAEMKVSRVTVHEHLAQLELKGALEKEPYLARSTRLTRRMTRELEKTLSEQSRYVGLEELRGWQHTRAGWNNTEQLDPRPHNRRNAARVVAHGCEIVPYYLH